MRRLKRVGLGLMMGLLALWLGNGLYARAATRVPANYGGSWYAYDGVQRIDHHRTYAVLRFNLTPRTLTVGLHVTRHANLSKLTQRSVKRVPVRLLRQKTGYRLRVAGTTYDLRTTHVTVAGKRRVALRVTGSDHRSDLAFRTPVKALRWDC